MKVGLLFCALLLTGCALSETELKTEAKVRFDKVYPVELAHYEYEERLQTFYDAEEILPEHLGRLYRGEFPNGETSPNKLRIHWTNARALAQAEVELQKDILGWAGADVSPRPILINDRADKFYRYYEYRVLKGGKEVGAVRIPAYRRTENFATAEVHQYNGDASQYTILPSAWFIPLFKKIIFSEGDQFTQLIKDQINQTLTKEHLTAYTIKLIENEPSLSPRLSDSQRKTIEKNIDDQIQNNVMSITNSEGLQKLIAQSGDSDPRKLLTLAKMRVSSDIRTLTTAPLIHMIEKNILFAMATNAEIQQHTYDYLMKVSVPIYLSIYTDIFLSILLSLSIDNGSKRTVIENIFHTYFWERLEEKFITHNISWNKVADSFIISDLLRDNIVTPVFEYQPKSFNYRTISQEELADIMTPHISLFLGKESLMIPITKSLNVQRSGSRSVISTITNREQGIRYLNDMVAEKILSKARTVNAKTQKMTEDFLDTLFDPGSWNLDDPNDSTWSILPTMAGTVSLAFIPVVGPAFFAAAAAVEVFVVFAKIGVFIKQISDTAKKLRNTGIDYIMNSVSDGGELNIALKDIQDTFRANGWELPNSGDGRNIGLLLDAVSNPATLKQNTEDRFLDYQIVDGINWYIPGAWNGNLYHRSFFTKDYHSIPKGAITISRAYCTKNVNKWITKASSEKIAKFLVYLRDKGFHDVYQMLWNQISLEYIHIEDKHRNQYKLPYRGYVYEGVSKYNEI